MQGSSTPPSGSSNPKSRINLPGSAAGAAAEDTESHRVYWQQWLSTNETSTGSRREWITSSVAIRMAPQAKAIDVTTLLRSSLGLQKKKQQQQNVSTSNKDEANEPKEMDQDSNNTSNDALVLVGTLYSLSSDFVQYEHHGGVVTSTARVISRGGGMHHRGRSASPPTTLSRTNSHASSSSNSNNSNTNMNENTSNKSSTTNTASRSEPFHLVYTLKADESPLQIRRRMVERIKTWEERAVQRNGGKGRHIMAPQIQWYFIPHIDNASSSSGNNATGTPATTTNNNTSTNNNSNNNIPNCLQLEGYCTSMEEDDPDETSKPDQDGSGDDDENDSSMEYDPDEGPGQQNIDDDDDQGGARRCSSAAFMTEQEKMEERFPWLKQPDPFCLSTTTNQTEAAATTTATSPAPTNSIAASALAPRLRRRRRLQRQLTRERQRGNDLIAACRASQPPSHLSGFLLKRCPRDRHVWRKVHCVLTDDYLWFMTRVYELKVVETNNDENDNNHNNSHSPLQEPQNNINYRPLHHRFSKHGRLRLTRALLLEPAVDYAPLYRTPYAFELVTPDGTCHAFRATSKHAQRQWIRVLSERIVQSYENSLLEQAQWMLVDQCQAQSLRMEQVLNVKDWVTNPSDKNGDGSNKPRRGKSGGDRIQIASNCLIHWGLRVADFRQLTRHVHSILPAKNPVIASSTVPSPTSNAQATLAALSLAPAPQSPTVQKWVRTSWQNAIDLWDLILAGPSKECQVLVNHHDDSNNSKRTHVEPFSYPRRVETLLRHVEFQMTGHHQPKSNGPRPTASSQVEAALTLHQGLPPPIDLFDDLFRELQTMVASLPSS